MDTISNAQAAIKNGNSTLQQLRQQASELEQEIERINSECDELKDLERVQERAGEELMQASAANSRRKISKLEREASRDETELRRVNGQLQKLESSLDTLQQQIHLYESDPENSSYGAKLDGAAKAVMRQAV